VLAVNGERRTAARGPSIAMWAGLTTLFGNLAAINVVALLGQEDSPVATTIAALFTAMASAAAVYTRERWHQDKRAEPSRAEPAYPPLYDPRRAEQGVERDLQAEASRAWLRAEAERAEQRARAEQPSRAEPSEQSEQSEPPPPPQPGTTPPPPPAV
jgi:hypothetical protein